MTLCRQKWPNMLLNMLQKPAKRAKKRKIWTKNNLFIVYKSYFFYGVTNAENVENFRENFFRVRFQIVHFSSEIALKSFCCINQNYTSKICSYANMQLY